MKIKMFSTSFQPAQEKYESFVNFENDLNEFIATVNVIDIKYSTAAGLCHDAQTHVNEFIEDFSALVMYEEKESAPAKKTTAAAKKPAAKKTASKKTAKEE